MSASQNLGVSILGPDKLRGVLSYASAVKTQGVQGDVVELGVYKGGTVIELARLFDNRTVYGYDTFEGLPSEDFSPLEVHHPGDFAHDALYDHVLRFVEDRVQNVRLVKGYFPNTALPHESIAFAHVDFDFYQGTLNATRWLLPRMSPGGVIVFDDYDWPQCPGVRAALDSIGIPVVAGVQYQVAYTHGA